MHKIVYYRLRMYNHFQQIYELHNYNYYCIYYYELYCMAGFHGVMRSFYKMEMYPSSCKHAKQPAGGLPLYVQKLVAWVLAEKQVSQFWIQHVCQAYRSRVQWISNSSHCRWIFLRWGTDLAAVRVRYMHVCLKLKVLDSLLILWFNRPISDHIRLRSDTPLILFALL